MMAYCMNMRITNSKGNDIETNIEKSIPGILSSGTPESGGQTEELGLGD